MRSVSVALAVTLLAGCGGGTETSEPPRSAMPVDRSGAPSGAVSTPLTTAIDLLLGPWLHAPIDLAPEALVAIGEACRTLQDAPGEMVIALVDARGGGSADAYLASADGGLETCIGLQIDQSGTVGDFLMGNSYGPGRWSAVGPREVDVVDRSHIEAPRDELHVAGLVGSDIAEVRFTADGREPIRATVMGGWFAAWLPAARYARYTLRGYDANGVEVFAIGDY